MVDKAKLLQRMKDNKAKRIKLLKHRSPEELVAMLELMGHFDVVNSDIAWLENQVKQEAKVNG